MNFLNLLSNPSSGTPLPTQPSTSISPIPNSSHNPNSPTPSTPPPSARFPKTNPPPPPISSSPPTLPPSTKSYPFPNPDGIKIKTDQSISSTQHPDAPEINPSARKTTRTCSRQRTRSGLEGWGRGKTRDGIQQKEDVRIPLSRKKMNKCGHDDKPHYAKGMCSNCYHRHGRSKKPWKCGH